MSFVSGVPWLFTVPEKACSYLWPRAVTTICPKVPSSRTLRLTWLEPWTHEEPTAWNSTLSYSVEFMSQAVSFHGMP